MASVVVVKDLSDCAHILTNLGTLERTLQRMGLNTYDNYLGDPYKKVVARKIFDACCRNLSLCASGTAIILINYLGSVLNPFWFIEGVEFVPDLSGFSWGSGDTYKEMRELLIAYRRADESFFEFLWGRRKAKLQGRLEDVKNYIEDHVNDEETLWRLLAFLDRDCHSIIPDGCVKTILRKMVQLGVISKEEFFEKARDHLSRR